MLSRFLEKLRSRAPKEPKAADPDATVAISGGPAQPQVKLPTWEPGQVILDRYQVEQVMAGSMGKIYICQHLGWGVKMAVKSPRPEVLADREGMKRILTEANAWVRMGVHPNVAACYYVLSIDKIPHLFIEYVDGGSLADWIEAGRCRNLRTALSLAIQFCHGMEFTHSKGIIHRDIKPQNILITKNSLLKITDFGILLTAQNRGEDEPEITGGDTGQDATIGFRGTPGYASPEQFRDTHKVDQRTDIFSFGLCLWVMLCGKKPFKHNAVKTPIPAPTPVAPKVTFPPALKRALKKCVAFDPDERYQSFAELRYDLNEAYAALFNAACPYAELTNIDMRADSLNNRAVSLLELGNYKDAARCLSMTLEINDMQPEAIYNQMLLAWKTGKADPARIIRRIEAFRKRTDAPPWFDDLERAVKRSMLGSKIDNRKGDEKTPEFRLCPPRTTLDVFREGQLRESVQRNIQDHLDARRYKACHDVLMTAWKNIGFRKEKFFNHVYERLLLVGEKEKVIGAQRFLTLKGQGLPASNVAHVPRSRKIVSAGPDGQILVRDLGKSQQVAFFGKKGLPITAMAVCPKGKHLAAGHQDGTVSLLSPGTGNVIATGPTHKGPVYTIGFSGDAKHLASGGGDGILKFLKLSTGPESSVSVQEGGPIRSLVFWPGTVDLATGSEDGKIRFWSQGGKECTRILEAHALPVTALSASADGKLLASASRDRQVKIWERQDGRCLKTIKAHEETITSVLIMPDNRTCISGCEDDIIKVWDMESGECLVTLDGRGDGITSLNHGPRPHTFLAGRRDGGVVLWMLIYQLAFD